MNKRFQLSAIFFVITLIASAQGGKVFDNLSISSKILKCERKYAIYLPPDYETSQRSYPVLYLLHGAGDSHIGWVQFGEVKQIADKAISEGKATSMIIVMPDANPDSKIGVMGFVNDFDGKWPYEDFFFNEFMPYIEKTYRIRTEKRYRAVSGNSMGGGGAFIYAFHHPDLFSSACPLSASMDFRSYDEVKDDVKKWFETQKKDYDEAKFKTYFENLNGKSLIENTSIEKLKSVRWYIDCGDDDFLYEANSLIHIAMRKKEIPHEFRIRDGGHGWGYWRVSLADVLGFVSEAFH